MTETVGVDEDSRLHVRRLRGEVPTIGGLLRRLGKACSDNAHTARAEPRHPARTPAALPL
ncbi:hypothetical protein [Streptomyces sp. NPDC001604]|uniref:hypothetical protein n=1 Tax=Streptomyces sp. NPDC001604 TaxID=3364593 RepID=UPI0036CA3E54